MAIDPTNSPGLTLENFMVKLCAHHKNQFIQVLNLCTEEQFKTSKSRSTALDSKTLNTEDYSNSFTTSNFAVEACILPANKRASPAFDEVKNCPSGVAQNLEYVTLPVKENPVTGMVLNNYIHASPQEEHNAKKHVLHIKPTAINSTLETGETGCTNKMELQQPDLSDCCVLSHSNATLIPVTVAQESEFLINLPTCADKENAQCTSPSPKLKQNTAHSIVTKHGPLNSCESFPSLAESSVSHLHKIGGHENLKHSKRCQNSSGLRIAEYGDHCDVVHLSETINAQSHFQHQKSFICSRNTARKSTRGYLFTGGCCQLSTVRTLVRSGKVEDKGNCALNISEALITPNGFTEAQTSTDIFQLEKSTANSTQNEADIHHKYKNNVHTISNMAGQSVNSDSLLAVFSLVHNESQTRSQIPHANKIFPKQIVEINTKDQGNISFVASTISENLENHISDTAHSAYESQAIIPKAETLNPELGYEAKVSHNDILLGKNNNQFLRISTVSSIDNCLVAPLLNKIDNSVHATLTSPPQNMPLEGRSIAMLTDFEPTCASSGPNTPPECPIKETKHMEGNITQIVEKYVQTPDYNNEFSEANTDICSVYLEPIVKNELILEPLKKDWLKTPNHFDKTSAEHDSCAKMAEIRDLQLEQSSVTKQSVEQYQTANSQFKSEETLQTKEMNENAKVAKLETIENDLLSNNCELSVPLKKVKKTIPSDRRLRSLQKNVSLHVLISQFSSLCSAQRFVEFSTEHAPQNETLMVFDSSIEESSDSEDCFKHILGNQYTEEKPMLSELMFRNKCYCTQNISENLKISLDLSSNKRNVYFCSDEMGCPKANESCVFPLVINSACEYKHNKSNNHVLAFASDSLTEAKGKTKGVSVKPVIQRTKIKFLKSKLRCNTSIECSDQQICSHDKKINGNDENSRPKFIDWCFEEEGQERISNFNGKYTSVHSNWIQLDKEMAAGPKSKNKSDKLKEIWRSKKRIRKSKFVEETKNHSPMQMLFMNGFKFSNICKWFLETTETKSLVIVKQSNTRSPEEHQLPVAPLQRNPSPSVTHKLQAERLKKHLRKFASVSQTHTQNALNKLVEEAQLGDSIKGASDKYLGSKVCVNKPTSFHIKKYSNFRQKMHFQSLPLERKQMAQNTETKMNYRQSIKQIPASNKTLQNVSNSPTCKPVINAGSLKAKKRPNEPLLKPMVQESKKRKIDAHQLNKNRCSMVALQTKKSVKTLGEKDAVAKCQPSEQHKSKSKTQKAVMLDKRKTTLQKKHSSKKLVVLKRLTRSSNRRPISPVVAEQRITRTTQSGLKKFNRKLCTGSKKCNKNPFKQRLRKSQPDSPMQNKRT